MGQWVRSQALRAGIGLLLFRTYHLPCHIICHWLVCRSQIIVIRWAKDLTNTPLFLSSSLQMPTSSSQIPSLPIPHIPSLPFQSHNFQYASPSNEHKKSTLLHHFHPNHHLFGILTPKKRHSHPRKSNQFTNRCSFKLWNASSFRQWFEIRDKYPRVNLDVIAFWIAIE